jgi:hypothetical protein
MQVTEHGINQGLLKSDLCSDQQPELNEYKLVFIKNAPFREK